VGGVSGGLGVAGVVGLPVSGFGLWASGFPGSGGPFVASLQFPLPANCDGNGYPWWREICGMKFAGFLRIARSRGHLEQL
jgi:hypothetical protein